MKFSRNTPFFLLLLPVFFVLHGFNRNLGSVQGRDAVILALLYIAVAISVAFVAWMFYRDLEKACYASFFLMAFNFFFGAIQDSLKSYGPIAFMAQYRFLLPLSLLVFTLLIIWLKKRKQPLMLLSTYLNFLFIFLVCFEITSFLIKKNKNIMTMAGNAVVFQPCDTCSKPDIYLIILDQYAGSSSLQEVFHYDNSPFDSALRERGFYIVANSRSNYDLTPFSMASLLHMDYLGEGMGRKGKLSVNYSYNAVRKNPTIRFLDSAGYLFFNNSLFDFPGRKAHRYADFFPYGTALISSQTFTCRLQKDIRSSILEGKFGSKKRREKITYRYLHFNDEIYQTTIKISKEDRLPPKFVYAHFMMPHWPYFYDSKGNPMPLEKLSGFSKTNENDYVEYLQYCNQKILALTDTILANSKKPPIIILLSDHGFRHPGKRTDRKYDFINLNAVLLPGRNYNMFYDGMTNVNEFRVIFNSCFNQRFPMLKDSTINLWD